MRNYDEALVESVSKAHIAVFEYQTDLFMTDEEAKTADSAKAREYEFSEAIEMFI